MNALGEGDVPLPKKEARHKRDLKKNWSREDQIHATRGLEEMSH